MKTSRRLVATSDDDAPIVIGVGKAGLRVASLLAARETRALRYLAVLRGGAPPGPALVPTLRWRGDAGGAERVARDIGERVEGARGAVLVCDLASEAAATIAPAVVRAVAPHVTTIAAVGIAPFSFEGEAKAGAADAASCALAAAADLHAVADREAVRSAVPPDTPLEKACAFVDEAAALSAETIARAGTCAREMGNAFGGARRGLLLGAGESTGDGSPARAARAAVEGSILTSDALVASRGAVLLLVTGRTPTLGEVGDAEGLLLDFLARDASVAVSIARDPSLGERALVAVCCVPMAAQGSREVFPSENPATLEIPAFLRRRSAGFGRRGRPVRRTA